MSASNFFPNGSTLALAVTTSGVAGTVTSTQPGNKFLVVNAGTQAVYFRLSTNTLTAASANIPTTGTTSPGQMINGGDSYVIGIPNVDGTVFPTVANIAANVSATSSTLYITPVLQSQ